MKKYYMRTPSNELLEVTKEERDLYFGDAATRPHVNKVYSGTISLEDVPEEMREDVERIVRNRTNKYGSYNTQAATSEDVERLIEALTNAKPVLTKGSVNRLIDELALLRDSSSDAVASRAITTLPALKHDGSLIKAGTRIHWAGVIKRAAVDLWDIVENNPDDAPSLWEDLNYKDGYRIIPASITVGTAFALDELGWWNGKLYKSLLNANVYTPDAYPAGWVEVEADE